MRHFVFLALVALYVVVIAQNWAFYTAAVLIVVWVRFKGKLGSVPFTIGGPRKPDQEREKAPPVTSGT